MQYIFLPIISYEKTEHTVYQKPFKCEDDDGLLLPAAPPAPNLLVGPGGVLATVFLVFSCGTLSSWHLLLVLLVNHTVLWETSNTAGFW